MSERFAHIEEELASQDISPLMLYWPVWATPKTICLPVMVDTYPSFLDHRSESLASRTFRVEVVMARARVLVADDNQMRDILTSTLADEFDVIRAVSDAGAALAAATQLLPDVAILDISMPVLNGIEVARRIRDAKTNVAVVFVTACSDLDTFHAASETGCFAYVLKLRLCSDLVRAINLALSGTRFVSPGIG